MTRSTGADGGVSSGTAGGRGSGREGGRRGIAWGIGAKLVLLVLAVLVPFVALAALVGREYRSAERQEALADASLVARGLRGRVDDYLHEANALLLAASRLVSPSPGDAERNDSLLTALRGSQASIIDRIAVWTPDGRNIGHSRMLDPGATRPADLPFESRIDVQRAMATRTLTVGTMIRSRATGEWTVPIIRPVLDEGRHIVAVVTLTTRLEGLAELLSLPDLPDSSFVAIFDSTGTTLARHPDHARFIGRNLGDRPTLREAIRRRSGASELTSTDGVPRLAAWETATHAPWLISVGVPEDAALARSSAWARRVLLYALATAALALLLAWRLANGIARPLRQLTADAVAFGAGALGRRTAVRGGGEIGALAEAFNEMAERRTTAEEEQRALLAVVERSSDFIGLATPEGKAIYLNDAGRRLVGLAPGADVREVPLDQFTADADLPRFHGEVLPAVLGRGWWSGELAFRHFLGGPPVEMDVRIFVITDPETGRPTSIATVNRPVGERRRLEDQLRQAQKMEAVGQLAGGVAHDFNNILTVIASCSQLLLEELGDDPRVQDVKEIRRAADRAASLTRQLLAFSRRQVLHPRLVDLNAVIGETEKMLQRLIGADLVLVTELAPQLGAVRVDPGQLEQVLVNLVVNARDAMPDGGCITLATGEVRVDEARAALDPEIPVGWYAVLTVSDTGVGMDDYTRSRIFEPFFTTKAQGKGTGLGLATVLGVVQQSGGHVRVQSERNRGTAFHVYLPIAASCAPAGVAEEPAPVSLGHETVLLVEDEDGVRTLARRILEARGHTVLAARHGRDALLVAERHEGPIDLVLTDVVMPEMGGRELAERMRVLYPDAPLVFMSGYTAGEIGERGDLPPGTSFVQKPFTPQGLAQAVREALDARTGVGAGD